GNRNEEQIEKFLKITDDTENRPIFINCTTAIRVDAFWIIRSVLRDGWKVEDAQAEAEKVGLRESPHWVEFARKYIETHRGKASIPSHPLSFGVFVARFDPAGSFTLEGKGWPKLNGSWKAQGDEVELAMSGGPGGCDTPGKYRFNTDGKQVAFDVVADQCMPRRMIIDRSTWLPAGEAVNRPPRKITLTSHARPPSRPANAKGSWPAFRGPGASGVADGQ